MDNQMMSQLLETYGFPKGAPVSARNANMIREFGASNPDVLERRAMRMRGSGVDDNSDLLDAMLERVMQQSAGPAITSQPLPPMPTVQNATQQTRRSATAARPESGPDAPLRTGGTIPQGSVTVPANEITANGYTPQGEQAGIPQTSGDSGFLPWILAALGIRAAAPSSVPITPQSAIGGPSPNALRLPPPQARITDQTVNPNMESVGQEIDTLNQRGQAAKTQMQSQIDVENKGLAARDAATGDERLLDQLIKQQNSRKRAADLAKKAAGVAGKR